MYIFLYRGFYLLLDKPAKFSRQSEKLIFTCASLVRQMSKRYSSFWLVFYVRGVTTYSGLNLCAKNGVFNFAVGENYQVYEQSDKSISTCVSLVYRQISKRYSSSSQVFCSSNKHRSSWRLFWSCTQFVYTRFWPIFLPESSLHKKMETLILYTRNTIKCCYVQRMRASLNVLIITLLLNWEKFCSRERKNVI